MDKQEQGKLIISAAKSLKGFQIAEPTIATYLYTTSEAGRLGLFISSIKDEKHATIRRIQSLAAQEGIGLHGLTTDLLPWLERAGLCELARGSSNEITEVTSLVLAYHDLLGAVADFYESRNPSAEDRACLAILAQADGLPTPESLIRQSVTGIFGEDVTNNAVDLVKVLKIVTTAGIGDDPLLYAPRVWSGLHQKAAQALSPLGATDREVLLYLVGRVRNSQGYPETLFRSEAKGHGAAHVVDIAIGIALVNRTELSMADGTTRSFLTTPHFYADLEDEFGEDMCDRVKIFLDSIRNGQYFGSAATGKILDPQVLLRALLNRGEIGPATAIRTDYIAAEKAGIISVRPMASGGRAVMALRQEDTVRKVLEVVTSGTMEPGRVRMEADHMADGTVFKSIEQRRAEPGGAATRATEIQNDIMKNLREG